jgi:hypothetical protein
MARSCWPFSAQYRLPETRSQGSRAALKETQASAAHQRIPRLSSKRKSACTRMAATTAAVQPIYKRIVVAVPCSLLKAKAHDNHGDLIRWQSTVFGNVLRLKRVALTGRASASSDFDALETGRSWVLGGRQNYSGPILINCADFNGLKNIGLFSSSFS